MRGAGLVDGSGDLGNLRLIKGPAWQVQGVLHALGGSLHNKINDR